MKNISEISATMTRIAELLRKGEKLEWAKRIEQYNSELQRDAAHTLSKIITLFGGMGSINDLVLYFNGQPMIKENNELDMLLSKLHNLCVTA
ncbi:hypothetical protein EQV97_12605 [Pseudomonas sp. TMW22090]|uniref:DUF6966 domain-containing protein n=1 Tax=Pseudomonas sp. TMW22090 TaxID=2506434 RepID=UPI000F082A2D|nr:hypothetical protein [Pseudomonas sp. TMW22090]MCH4878224.1 hypothetical protein [Pseudomonas sp. TMW22090]